MKVNADPQRKQKKKAGEQRKKRTKRQNLLIYSSRSLSKTTQNMNMRGNVGTCDAQRKNMPERPSRTSAVHHNKIKDDNAHLANPLLVFREKPPLSLPAEQNAHHDSDNSSVELVISSTNMERLCNTIRLPAVRQSHCAHNPKSPP